MTSLLNKYTFLIGIIGLLITMAWSAHGYRSETRNTPFSGIVLPVETGFDTDTLVNQSIENQHRLENNLDSVQSPNTKPQTENTTAKIKIAILDETLKSEKTDQNWSINTAVYFEELLNSKDFNGSEFVAVTCAATLCKLETRQQNQYLAQKFLDRFPLAIGWDANTYGQLLDKSNSNQTVVFYISRLGYRLPLADQKSNHL